MEKETIVGLIAIVMIVSVVAFSGCITEKQTQHQEYIENWHKAGDEGEEAGKLSDEAKQYLNDYKYSKAAIKYYDAQSHMEMAEVYSKAAMESAPTVEDKEYQKNMGMVYYYMSKTYSSYGEICDELANPQPNKELTDQKYNEAQYYQEKAREYIKKAEYAI